MHKLLCGQWLSIGPYEGLSLWWPSDLLSRNSQQLHQLHRNSIQAI